MADVAQAHVEFEIAKANLERAKKAEKKAREQARNKRIASHRESGKPSFWNAHGGRSRSFRPPPETPSRGYAATRSSKNPAT